MYISKRLLAAGLIVVLTAASMAFALNASGHGKGHGGGKKILDSTLAPSKTTDPVIHGVAADGANWFLERGSVRLRRDGRISVRIRELVQSSGDPGSVTAVRPSLFCGNDAATTPVGTTDSAPLSDDGHARIDDELTLPSSCVAWVVLIKPILGPTEPSNYIAATGFRA